MKNYWDIFIIHVQCSPFKPLCLWPIGMDSLIGELLSVTKGHVYKGIIGKLPYYGHFPIISLLNYIVKKLGART